MNKIKLLTTMAVVSFGFCAWGANATYTLEAVGTASSTSGANPCVGLIDRGDGSYALVFTNAQTTTFTFSRPFFITEALVVGGGGSGCDNCVSLVARDASGNVVSRNYALVKTFRELSVRGKQPTNQESLRFHTMYGQTDGGGAALGAKRFDNETELTSTATDWSPVFPSPDAAKPANAAF